MARQSDSAPEFVKFMGPVLGVLSDLGGSGRPDEVRSAIVKALKISEDEQAQRLPSGVQSRFENQVHWARFYLAKGGYIDSSRHGVWALTEKARALGKITPAQAREIYRVVAAESREGAASAAIAKPAPVDEQVAPVMEDTHGRFNYREAVLARLQALPPTGFERFCQRLLRESGFEEVMVTGRAGDGGIDGIGVLQVNPLVSFKVLFQCKRYAGSVTPSQVRDFRGAMMGRADKGIILTTGSFTSEARKEAVRDGVPAIELVDGEKLIVMIEDLELGLKPVKTFDMVQASSTSSMRDIAAQQAAGGDRPPSRPAPQRQRRCADLAGAMTEASMSRMSSIGILILAVSIAPFAVLCITDALGWTGPSTGCGIVALAVIGCGVGVVVWMVGLLSSPRQPRGAKSLRD